MKIILDTSVMVATLVAAHPAHARAVRRYEHLLSEGDKLFLCAHSLAELYAVLTRMPTSPRIGPDTARRLIEDNIRLTSIGIVSLDAKDYMEVVDRMATLGLVGGVMYDMLIVQAARKTKAHAILTLNEFEFSRLCANESFQVLNP